MKISRKFYIALSVISFVALFLTVSGVEQDTLSVGKGLIAAALSIAIGAYAGFKGGVFDV